jgi:hypothetical protein
MSPWRQSNDRGFPTEWNPLRYGKAVAQRPEVCGNSNSWVNWGAARGFADKKICGSSSEFDGYSSISGEVLAD